MLVWQLGGASTVWKLDYFTRWELCQAVDRGSKKFLLTVTAIYTFLCVVVLATFLALTIVDVQVRCLTASTSPSRRTSWAHLQPCARVASTRGLTYNAVRPRHGQSIGATGIANRATPKFCLEFNVSVGLIGSASSAVTAR